ncbi:hypothetical protein [uncultured Dubosiella sp.]|jgi:hypothetical protein|uniref:hypothetical protein n=1 Tax=uncultured Dubosiella sp. TaxID=1937011 RepID=UPI00208066C2|nr:hypothetical protein [uncultured Dubosiella sp.]GJM56650.1 hypothetical protein EROP_03430 [Erysipelotrichaceae bacterium OPF54]
MEQNTHYSALIFDLHQNETNSLDNLKTDIRLFAQDPDCSQIVVSCLSDLQLTLALSPQPKTTLVKMAKHPYVSLVNGLKAVTEENVLIVGLSKPVRIEQKSAILHALEEYPAVECHQDLQAYDTRLLMFCLQHSIEQNIAIESYAQAVSALGDTPILKL